MKRENRIMRTTLLTLFTLVGVGCGDDPKPAHVEGGYWVNCENGCSRRQFGFVGDNGKDNESDPTGAWPEIYMICEIDTLRGGSPSVTAFVSNQPLGLSGDVDRNGFEIVNTVVTDGVPEMYWIRMYDEAAQGTAFEVNDRALEDGQDACSVYSLTILGKKSFQVDFACRDMRTSFSYDPRITEQGNIVFSNCD